jgi:hypothetical protein
MVEEKVYATFGAEGDKDRHRWVMDTGASNHMTVVPGGVHQHRHGTTSTVQFGDGSVVWIEG